MHFCVDINTAPFWEHQGFWQCWLPLCFKGLKTTEPPCFPFGGLASFNGSCYCFPPALSLKPLLKDQMDVCQNLCLYAQFLTLTVETEVIASVSQWCLPSLLPMLLLGR